MTDEKLLTISEAAKYLRISPKTMQRLCKQGDVPGAFRIGGQWRIKLQDLLNSGVKKG